MLHFSGKHVGHGLEAAVRMVGSADGLAGPVLDWSHLVEKQERVGVTQAIARKRPPHDETAAFPLAMRRDDFGDFARVRHHSLRKGL